MKKKQPAINQFRWAIKTVLLSSDIIKISTSLSLLIHLSIYPNTITSPSCGNSTYEDSRHLLCPYLLAIAISLKGCGGCDLWCTPIRRGGGGWRVEPWLILLTPSKSCTDHIHLPAPGSNFRTESTRRNEILCKFVSGDAKIWEIWIIRNIVKCRICCLLLIFWRLLFRKYRGVQ